MKIVRSPECAVELIPIGDQFNSSLDCVAILHWCEQNDIPVKCYDIHKLQLKAEYCFRFETVLDTELVFLRFTNGLKYDL